jgi:hypothetical protein
MFHLKKTQIWRLWNPIAELELQFDPQQALKLCEKKWTNRNI